MPYCAKALASLLLTLFVSFVLFTSSFVDVVDFSKGYHSRRVSPNVLDVSEHFHYLSRVILVSIMSRWSIFIALFRDACCAKRLVLPKSIFSARGEALAKFCQIAKDFADFATIRVLQTLGGAPADAAI